MRERRGVQDERRLCSGPGRLTQALDLELELNGSDLQRGPIVFAARPAAGFLKQPLHFDGKQRELSFEYLAQR